VVLWFAGAAFVLVWVIFRSPALDYRLVMLGAVLPVGEALVGGPWLLHTLVGGVALLLVVVLATQRRRLVRRRWIGLPIGVLLHLALDGSFTRAGLFWWPFLGLDEIGQGGVPEVERGLGPAVVFELIGLVCLVWCYRRFGLDDPGRRQVFLGTGHLDRRLAAER
jgi:hypothetical protein